MTDMYSTVSFGFVFDAHDEWAAADSQSFSFARFFSNKGTLSPLIASLFTCTVAQWLFFFGVDGIYPLGASCLFCSSNNFYTFLQANIQIPSTSVHTGGYITSEHILVVYRVFCRMCHINHHGVVNAVTESGE